MYPESVVMGQLVVLAIGAVGVGKPTKPTKPTKVTKVIKYVNGIWPCSCCSTKFGGRCDTCPAEGELVGGGEGGDSEGLGYCWASEETIQPVGRSGHPIPVGA